MRIVTCQYDTVNNKNPPLACDEHLAYCCYVRYAFIAGWLIAWSSAGIGKGTNVLLKLESHDAVWRFFLNNLSFCWCFRRSQIVLSHFSRGKVSLVHFARLFYNKGFIWGHQCNNRRWWLGIRVITPPPPPLPKVEDQSAEITRFCLPISCFEPWMGKSCTQTLRVYQPFAHPWNLEMMTA